MKFQSKYTKLDGTNGTKLYQVVAIRGPYQGVMGFVTATRGSKSLVSMGKESGTWIATKELRAVR